MKANLKRKIQIAREVVAEGATPDLDNLNWHKRPGDRPRHFTVELTDVQKKRCGWVSP